MFDWASINVALGSAKIILDLLKNANDAQLAVGITAEIAKVQGSLIDVQQQALALQAENQQLRAEVEKFRLSKFHHSVVWRVLPDGTEDGPFCPVCAGDGVEMRLRLRDVVDQSGSMLRFECPKSHLVGFGTQGIGREPHYPIPKDLVPENRYFIK